MAHENVLVAYSQNGEGPARRILAPIESRTPYSGYSSGEVARAQQLPGFDKFPEADMRTFASAVGVLAMLMGTSVQAADIPVKAPQPLPQAAWNWSGFYVGVGGSLN
jgi:hypothetical protein